MFHLITIGSIDDAVLIRKAMEGRFGSSWKFSINNTDLGENIYAEYMPPTPTTRKSRKKGLTAAEHCTYMNLLPACAQFFYAGLCKGREQKV